MQDRLMSEVGDLIDDAEEKRERRRVRKALEDETEELRERLDRITRPIGESPHEPPSRRKRPRTN